MIIYGLEQRKKNMASTNLAFGNAKFTSTDGKAIHIVRNRGESVIFFLKKKTRLMGLLIDRSLNRRLYKDRNRVLLDL